MPVGAGGVGLASGAIAGVAGAAVDSVAGAVVDSVVGAAAGVTGAGVADVSAAGAAVVCAEVVVVVEVFGAGFALLFLPPSASAGLATTNVIARTARPTLRISPLPFSLS
jgi:hypothetical protein